MPLPFLCSRIPIVMLAAAVHVVGYEAVPPPEKVVLPPPLSAEDSLAAIMVPEGMRVELVAAEPAVRDPIDLAWGADGRMWVVEMGDYPLGLDGQGQAGGRIVVLESTKREGEYDRAMVFAEGLRFPTSVLPWRKGVLVTTVPDVLYLEDTDGDGRADLTKVVFTGLGEGNQQHLTNGLQWGLDGWLYMANGGSRGTIVSPASGETLDIGQRDLRIKPDEGRVESQSGRSQYGRSRDDWGNWFGGNNSNPVWHYALQDHYLRRNPQLAPPNSTVTVPEIPGAAPVYPVSETLARFNSPQGFNHFTSACGVMIYRDTLLGPDYAGNVFVAEPVHNLVHRELVRPAGVTFSSRRAPEELNSEFFASADNWSRFTSVRAGPDGALYIVDMYRLVIEHPKWIPDDWQKQLGDLRAGADRGRIYRVYPRDAALRPVPRLDQEDTTALVVALESPSGVVRDLAQQQLLWRGAKGAVAGLERLSRKSDQPQTRVQALCSLDLIGALRPALLADALADAHPGVRRQAVRLSEGFAGSNPELLPILIALVDDPDATVRQQVGYSLGEWTKPAAGVALARLVQSAEDPFIVAAAMSSARPHAGTIIAQLTPADAIDRTLIEIAAATQDLPALVHLLRLISAPRPGTDRSSSFRTMAQLLDSLSRNDSSLERLAATGGEIMQNAVAGADKIFSAARDVASLAGGAIEQRVAAVALLGRGSRRQAEDLHILAGLLTPQSAVDVQLAVVAAMAHLDQPSIPEWVLSGWDGHGAKVRVAVLDLLASRPKWANALLDHIAADPAMLSQIDTAHQAALTHHSDPGVAARASLVLSTSLDPDRQKVIDQYLAGTRPLIGDRERGAEVYRLLCAACHKFGSLPGGAIGPDLASLNERSTGHLITHILDPNRAVESRYVLYTALTNDGRTLSGMLSGEAGNSITLLGLDGMEQVILRSELRSLTSTGRSLMPDGLEGAIDAQAMVDLVSYIARAAENESSDGGE